MSFPNWCNSSSGRSWASLKYTEEDERERWRLKVKIRRFVKISIEKILFWCQLIQLKEVHRTELKRRNRKRDRFVRLFCLGNNSTFYFYTVISTWFVDFFFYGFTNKFWCSRLVWSYLNCILLLQILKTDRCTDPSWCSANGGSRLWTTLCVTSPYGMIRH